MRLQNSTNKQSNRFIDNPFYPCFINTLKSSIFLKISSEVLSDLLHALLEEKIAKN